MGRVKSLLFALFFLACPLVYGQSLIIHGYSFHTAGGDQNNSNLGVGFTTDKNVIFGFYKNSQFATTVYGGYRLDFSDKFGVVLGGATGYRGRAVSPLVMPFTRFPTDWFAVVLGAAPYKDTDLNKYGLVVHLMIEYKW